MSCSWGHAPVRLGLVVGLVGAAGAAGCGGSDFVSQVNALCNSYQAQAKAIPKPVGLSGVPPYADRALPPARAFIAKLGTIAPPSDKRVGYQQYLAGAEREVMLLQETSSAVREGDTRRAGVSAKQLSTQVRLDDAQAAALGLKECAKG